MKIAELRINYKKLFKFSEFAIETFENLNEVMTCSEREELYKWREEIEEILAENEDVSS